MQTPPPPCAAVDPDGAEERPGLGTKFFLAVALVAATLAAVAIATWRATRRPRRASRRVSGRSRTFSARTCRALRTT
jgi:hypothetical protein